MNKLKNLIDRAIFFLLSVALVILLIFWKGCDMKGPGDGQPGSQPSNSQQQGTIQGQDTPEQKSTDPDVQPQSGMSEPSSKIVKLFLGRKGVSEDRVNWHDLADFADYIKQLQDKGIAEVNYTLLPDSIERYEERWAEELKKANMRSYINTD